MCIALLSTAHPRYKLILIDNRDEYLNRPTAKAAWWTGSSSRPSSGASPSISNPPPASDTDEDTDGTSYVLSGRDLLRPARGTWLGITLDGRIAVLTNFRENPAPPPTAVSRGEIIKKFLASPASEVGSTEDFVAQVVNSGLARDAGGFTLICGRIGGAEDEDENEEEVGSEGGGEDVQDGTKENKKENGNEVEKETKKNKRVQKLAVVSNRAHSDSDIPWICGDVIQTVGASNASFLPERTPAEIEQGVASGSDTRWKKVKEGELGMLYAIRQNVVDQGSEDDLIRGFLELLSQDTLYAINGDGAGVGVVTGKDDNNDEREPLTAEEREGGGLETYISELRNTILVPPLGRKAVVQSTTTAEDADAKAYPADEFAASRKQDVAQILDLEESSMREGSTKRRKLSEGGDEKEGLGMTGIYGTQKQTVVLVDHDDNVRFFERTLYDEESNPITKGEGDVEFKFKIRRKTTKVKTQYDGGGKEEGREAGEE